MFEQGLIHATFLVVHTSLHIYLIVGAKKNERLLDFRVRKKSHFYNILFVQLNITEEASK